VGLTDDRYFRTHEHGGRSWLVPREDVECVKVVFDGPRDLEVAYKYVKHWGVAVQAGGNFGAWPRAMAERFATVYTFEPDPVNFACLSVNLADKLNVVKMQAALGSSDQRTISIVGDRKNSGALHVGVRDEEDEEHEYAPGVLPLTDLDAIVGDTAPGLIQLDLEGFEYYAIEGYRGALVDGCRPVFMVEEKGLGAQYEVPDGQIAKYLARFGYREVDRVNRDVIYAVAK